MIYIYQLNQVDWVNWLTMTIHSSALCLLDWIVLWSNFQPKTNVTIILLHPLLLRRLQHWTADAVAHRQLVKHSFFCTVALFCILTPFSCRDDRLSPFLSEDIHQRNVSAPSLVTPSSLCQLYEPQNWLLQALAEGGLGCNNTSVNMVLSHDYGTSLNIEFNTPTYLLTSYLSLCSKHPRLNHCTYTSQLKPRQSPHCAVMWTLWCTCGHYGVQFILICIYMHIKMWWLSNVFIFKQQAIQRNQGHSTCTVCRSSRIVASLTDQLQMSFSPFPSYLFLIFGVCQLNIGYNPFSTVKQNLCHLRDKIWLF